MSSEVNFRAATNADIERIKQIVFGVLEEFGLKTEADGCDADLNDIEENHLKRGGVFEVLENENGEILGTIALLPIDDETVELRKMYFDEKLRGRGFGKKALERMIEKSKELGYKKIHLETASTLKEAVGLYTKYGFKPASEGIHAERSDTAFTLDI